MDDFPETGPSLEDDILPAEESFQIRGPLLTDGKRLIRTVARASVLMNHDPLLSRDRRAAAVLDQGADGRGDAQPADVGVRGHRHQH